MVTIELASMGVIVHAHVKDDLVVVALECPSSAVGQEVFELIFEGIHAGELCLRFQREPKFLQ